MANSTPATLATPVRCGELHCQRDSFAKSLHTHVVSCRPSTLKADKGKLWEARLQDTVLFPEGGGQPWDTGTVGGVPVKRVVNVDGEAVHFLAAPLEEGIEVEVLVDWQRRLDNMQQHTGQHLITAVAIDMFNYPTESWTLGPDVTTLDLGTEELKPDQMDALERRVNELIWEQRAVEPRWISPDSEEREKIRCRGLPEGVTGPLRVLEIDGVDTNLCCGTHLQNLGQLRLIKILRTERVRDKGKTFTRLHFVAGDRVLSILGSTFGRQQQLNNLLSVGPEKHTTRVESLLKGETEANKELKTLWAEVTEFTANRLKQQVAQGEAVLEVHREDGNLNFMRGLASALDDCDAVLLTTCGGPEEGTFMLSGPETIVAELGPNVANILHGRGGGKGRYQGKVSKLSARGEAVKMLRAARSAATTDASSTDVKGSSKDSGYPSR